MKYNKEIINLILDAEQLAPLLDTAVSLIDIINQSDDATFISQKLTQPDNMDFQNLNSALMMRTIHVINLHNSLFIIHRYMQLIVQKIFLLLRKMMERQNY